jgi:hypothetical protein
MSDMSCVLCEVEIVVLYTTEIKDGVRKVTGDGLWVMCVTQENKSVAKKVIEDGPIPVVVRSKA